MTGPALHTVEEASRILRKSRSWIYKAMKDRRIPYTQIGGGKFLSEDDIAEIIRNGARPAQDKPARRQTAKAAKKATQARVPRPRLAAPAESPTRVDIPRADPTASRKYRPPQKAPA
jgi:excisionase family DNA binding protein